MNLEEVLAKRPVNKQAVAEHKARMEQAVAEAAKPEAKPYWRHGDWD